MGGPADDEGGAVGEGLEGVGLEGGVGGSEIFVEVYGGAYDLGAAGGGGAQEG